VCYEVRQSRKRDDLVLLKKEDATLDEVTCVQETDSDLDKPYADLPIPVATGIYSEKGSGFKLVGFQVDCFKTTDKDEEPLEEWDSEKQSLLPSRVTVTLTYQDDQEKLYPFSKTVLLRLQELELSPPGAGGGGPSSGNGNGGYGSGNGNGGYGLGNGNVKYPPGSSGTGTSPDSRVKKPRSGERTRNPDPPTRTPKPIPGQRGPGSSF
jgi:hypothetical protein